MAEGHHGVCVCVCKRDIKEIKTTEEQKEKEGDLDVVFLLDSSTCKKEGKQRFKVSFA